MKAFNLKRVDQEYDMHLLAWLAHQVTATKTKGTGKSQKQVPVFERFEDFFDYKKRIQEVEGTKNYAITLQMKKMARIAANLNRGGR